VAQDSSAAAVAEAACAAAVAQGARAVVVAQGARAVVVAQASSRGRRRELARRPSPGAPAVAARSLRRSPGARAADPVEEGRQELASRKVARQVPSRKVARQVCSCGRRAGGVCGARGVCGGGGWRAAAGASGGEDTNEGKREWGEGVLGGGGAHAVGGLAGANSAGLS
jgi:hypothetical protein